MFTILKRSKLALVIMLVFVAILLWFLVPKPLSRDGQFIADHEEPIKELIWDNLDPDKSHIKTITLQPSTARGGFEGSISRHYYIDFLAFTNDDRGYQIVGEIGFPETGMGYFSFIEPDPYTGEGQDMTTWFVTAERTNASQWQWKIDEEERLEQAERVADEIRWQKIEADIERFTPLVREWVKLHEPSLKQVIYDVLLKEEPETAKHLGELLSLEVDRIYNIQEDRRGVSVIFLLRFSHYPEDVAVFRTSLFFDDISFQEMTKGGEMTFVDTYYNIEFDIGSEAAEAVKLATGEVIIREVDHEISRID